jgi:hypothetical protein
MNNETTTLGLFYFSVVGVIGDLTTFQQEKENRRKEGKLLPFVFSVYFCCLSRKDTY